MRIVSLAAVLLALATSASLAGESESAPGIVWSPRGAVLTRVDAVSRLALPGSGRVLLGHAHYAVSTSPDGALMASASGIERRVHLADLTAFGKPWTIGPLSAQIRSTYWIARRTLAAVMSDNSIALLDVNAGSVRRQIPAGGEIVGDAAVMGRYVALVAPAGSLGALRLITVSAAGRVRTIALPGLRGGRALTPGRAARMALPGLALSPGGTRAYVVPRGNRVVVANLSSGRAHAMGVRPDRTLQSATKLAGGWQRTAQLLGSRTLVVSGGDLSGREYGSFLSGAPAGLRLIDLRTRRSHVAIAGVNQFRICGGIVVAARSLPDAASAGVVALDGRGATLWSQFSGAGVVLAGCTSRYVYLSIPGTGFATLDAHSGSVLETHRGSAAMVIELS